MARKTNCGQVVAMGSLTGFLVGGSMGILGGGYGAFAGGMRGRELMRAAGKASVQGGAMFALILGIGSALRGCLK